MASRKVFDIIPPRESKEPVVPAKPAKKPEKPARQAFAEKLAPVPQPKQVVVEIASRSGPKLNLNRKAIWWPSLTVLAILAVGSAGYFLIKPKAELEIWPVKSPLAVKTQVFIDKNAVAGTGTILGEVKTYDCSSSREFPATGKTSVSTKAGGTIRVYNSYSTSPQTLIANTRFVSDGGKLFRTPQKIIIPGAHYEGGKLIPGEVDAYVEAGEAGGEYNIGPSTFSLPALAGTSRYTAFYAKSFGSMTGGSESNSILVSADDLANAEEVLTEAALSECKALLNNSLPVGEYVVEEDAVKSEVVKVEPLAEEGQAAEKFFLNVKTKATALVFKQSDLSEFAKTYIATKVPEGKQLNANSVVLSYLPQSVDLERGKIILAVEISAEVYPTIDENRIKEAVRSQTPDEMTVSLRQLPEVDRFQLRLWPFWVNRAPFETAGIAIKLRLD